MRRWLTPLLLTAFCFSLLAFAYVSKQPLCIDSKYVEKFDIVEGAIANDLRVSEIYRCAIRKKVEPTTSNLKLADKLNRFFKSSEQTLELIAPFRSRIKGSIFADSDGSAPGNQYYPHLFTIHLSDLGKGNSLSQSAVFEIKKALLGSWFYQQVIQKNQIEQNLVLHLLNIILNDESSSSELTHWRNALIANELRISNRSWDQIFIPSMREAYFKLSTRDRILFLRNLLDFLNESALSNSEDLQFFNLTTNMIVGKWPLLKKLAQDPIGNQWLKYFETQLAGIGLKIEQEWIVEKEGPQRVLRTIPTFFDKDIVGLDADKGEVQVDSSFYVYAKSGGGYINKKILPETNAKRMAIRVCGVPSVSEINQKVSPLTISLLIVNDCQNSVDWLSYFNDGIQVFMKKNVGLKFMYLNMGLFRVSLEQGNDPMKWTGFRYIKDFDSLASTDPLQAIEFMRQ